MTESLISIIIPVYNVERYLAACLDSILDQKYRNLEIIVINDGSDDFSLKIVETYAEKDIRVIVYNFENEGLAEARNHGLSVATGDLIMFVDSDDFLLHGALEVLLKVMEVTGAEIVEGKTIKGSVYAPVHVKKTETRVFTAEEALSEMLYQKELTSSVCGKIFKRELFEGLRFEKGIVYEDLDIMYRVFERCSKIAYIDYPVYFYREREGSIINTWDSRRLDVLKVTENMEHYIGEHYPGLLRAARDRRLSANFNMFALCSKHGDNENAMKCWDNIKYYRMSSFFNPKVRIKNKGGILLSYLGRRLFKMVAKRVYK